MRRHVSEESSGHVEGPQCVERLDFPLAAVKFDLKESSFTGIVYDNISFRSSIEKRRDVTMVWEWFP